MCFWLDICFYLRRMKRILLIGACLILIGIFSVNGQSVGELNQFDGNILEEVNKVQVYPNPTTDYLRVRIQNTSFDDAELTVYNIIGNEVKVEVNKVASNDFKITVKDLPPGYYLLAVKADNQQFKETYKFLKRQ